jgi:Bacterial Ig domain/Cellulose binding domain/Calx-beta domain/Glycosyl hydrolases family 18
MTNFREFSGRSEPRRGRRRVRPMYETLEVRLVPSGVAASFAVTQDWGSGFQATLSLKNNKSTNFDDWAIEFDYGASINSIWDAAIVSHTGNHYVIRGAGWNNSLAAGGAVSFGFVGSPGQTTAPPANYVLNGAPLGGVEQAAPALSINDVVGSEPAAGSTPFQFKVELSFPSTQTVTVRYSTSDATAKSGADYQAVSGTLTFAPGETSKTILVPVFADELVEGDETFNVVLSSPSGATLAKAQGIGTIKDATPAPQTTGNVTFLATSDWGSGFNGQITVKNSGSKAWTGWTLEFDYGGQISSLWDASLVSRVGDHYVIRNATYNGAVAAGATVSIGFTAIPGGAKTGPSNYIVNGGGPVNHPPVAQNDTAWTSPGRAVNIPVLANDSDPDGDPLIVVSAAQGRHGAVVVGGDGTITYTPTAGYTGTDAFIYTISDGRGGTASATVALTVSSLTWPAHVFAPYVDMGLYPTYNLVSAAQSQGLKYFNLGFVVADANKKPSWGGYTEYEISGTAFDQGVRSQVSALRGLGGDVAVSFGGASNLELAQVITDVKALQAAYQSVIDAYGLTRVDFDIEGGAVADRASIDRRSQVLAALQQVAATAGKPLQVWLTLPVLPTGLTGDGLYVVQSAIKYGVTVSGVNVMAMDYGDSAAPNPAGRMGAYALQAATSTFNQLKTLYGGAKTDAQLWAMIGVTPMIGLNDVTTEVFDQSAARELLAFAREKGIGQISMWSLNRDQQNPNGKIGYVDLTSSSLLQNPYEFALIFKPFTS